jgi:hypothetical protein
MRNPQVERDVGREIGLRRFPKRTLLLMILALAVFVRFWCLTHPQAEQKPRPIDVQIRQ